MAIFEFRNSPFASPHVGEGMKEQLVTIPSAFDVAGTFCLPGRHQDGAPHPAVLLIGGSGADTRDGDLQLPGPGEETGPGTLRQVAHHLGHHGIASLRCDRRGFGASGGRAEASDYATDLEDAKASFAWLRSRPDVDGSRIAVAGHSAGALTTCHVCRDVPDVAAAALLGALASPIEDMLRWNIGHWHDVTPEQQQALIDESPTDLLRAEGIDKVLAAARAGEEVVHLEGRGLSVDVRLARLGQDLETSYDGELRHVACPALVLHGGSDLNVPVEDALTTYRALRRAGNADVELVVLPGLDHYFIPASPDPARRVFERLSRAALRRPMAQRALEAITAWAGRELAPGTPEDARSVNLSEET